VWEGVCASVGGCVRKCGRVCARVWEGVCASVWGGVMPPNSMSFMPTPFESQLVCPPYTLHTTHYTLHTTHYTRVSECWRVA
jgi:hypothetical protein